MFAPISLMFKWNLASFHFKLEFILLISPFILLKFNYLLYQFSVLHLTFFLFFFYWINISTWVKVFTYRVKILTYSYSLIDLVRVKVPIFHFQIAFAWAVFTTRILTSFALFITLRTLLSGRHPCLFSICLTIVF